MTGPVVVCSIAVAGSDETLAAVEAAPEGCSLLELRADRAPQVALDLLARSPKRFIVTIRRAADGGGYGGSEAERSALLRAALARGARYVDVEHGSEAATLVHGPDPDRVILSSHGAACHLEELRALYAALCRTGATRLKIVPRTDSEAELLALPRLLAETRGGPPLACFAAGGAGVLSRVLAPRWGSWATYGSAGAGAETGEGQLPAAELLGGLNVLGIGEGTSTYALVGEGVAASPSPAMHAAGYRALGLDARYLALGPRTLDAVLPLLGPAGERPLQGLGVTIPFKVPAAEAVEPADDVAAASGAVNTIVAHTGRPVGYNTDGPAAVSLVREHLDPDGARVAVIGTGGTARGLATAFRLAGSRVALFGRRGARAAEVGRRLGLPGFPWEALADHQRDVLAHCTPLGRAGEPVPWAPERGGRLVLDAVYGPQPTPLVREARARGLDVIEGLDLLVRQAVGQFGTLTGRPVKEAILRAAARAFLATCGGE